jgi:predicted dehydrogenase
MTMRRIAVIGAGHMGRLHASKVAALRDQGGDVELAGVADLIGKRARAVANEVRTHAVTDFHSLLPGADAAIVAVPTVEHFGVVRDVLAAGCDVLVEKPIAASVDEAQELLELARAGERVLQVGHLEWFNTAMQVIREHIHRPLFVEAQRVGPFPARATDVDVVRDLMIHDLDILQQLIGEEPSKIEAVGVPVLTSSVDIANARVTYPGGAVANLTASRVSHSPMRRMRLFQQDGYFAIDFLAQSAVVYRREPGDRGRPPRIEKQRLEVHRGDALLEQLRSFVGALRTRDKPTVDGAGALGALRTALRVIDAMPTLERPV